jgi:hypothetical protein
MYLTAAHDHATKRYRQNLVWLFTLSDPCISLNWIIEFQDINWPVTEYMDGEAASIRVLRLAHYLIPKWMDWPYDLCHMTAELQPTTFYVQPNRKKEHWKTCKKIVSRKFNPYGMEETTERNPCQVPVDIMNKMTCQCSSSSSLFNIRNCYRVTHGQVITYNTIISGIFCPRPKGFLCQNKDLPKLKNYSSK